MNFFKQCRRVLVMIVFAVMVLFSPQKSSAQIADKDSLRILWKNQNYTKAVELGRKIRNAAFGRTAEVDYIMGTSYCRLGAAEKGIAYLNWCLNSYPLDANIRGDIQFERDNCSATVQPSLVFHDTIDLINVSAGVRSRSKMYYYLEDNNVIRNDAIKVTQPPDIEEIKARLIPLERRDQAQSLFQSKATGPYAVRSKGKFIIVSASSNTDFDYAADQLSILEKFLSDFLDLRLPDYMITVYLVPSIEELQALAQKLHGLDIPDRSIGYSYQDDLSVLAYSPGRFSTTAFHELFHLMSKSTFGDIPPWLDEGTAALYEVSRIDGERVIGIDNWRAEILRQLWHIRPALSDLVTMDWQTFDKIELDEDASHQAVNHAMARYFVKYLQDNGLLDNVFSMLRHRDPETTMEGDGHTAVIPIIETVMGKNIEKIDNDFEDWFSGARRSRESSETNEPAGRQ